MLFQYKISLSVGQYHLNTNGKVEFTVIIVGDSLS